MTKRSKVTRIYDDYIAHLNDIKSKRYDQMEEWFHSSSAGLCARKHYYSTIEKIKTAPREANTMRLFRLGDVIHQDIQDSVEWYARNNGIRYFVEKEILIHELGVRGFIDLAMIDDGILYDIKSCNSWKWKGIFGRGGTSESVKNYMMQTATYGYWYQKYYHECDLKEMKLLFYKKDTSDMRELDIPISMIQEAENYWKDVQSYTKEKKLPPVKLGHSPVMSWECNEKYCSYFEACGGGLLAQQKR
jgi:hypothetical protein|tara:strand:+ start:621 stop:1358 length:738 start_codon:yes stop_codon:yes gene_type:complete